MHNTTSRRRRLTLVPAILLLAILTTGARADLAISSHAPDIADLTGERGTRTSSPMELSRGKAAIALTLLTRNGVSCGIALEGRKLGANANFETEQLERCSGGKGSSKTSTLDAGTRAHIVGFRLCISRDTPIRTGGHEIATQEVTNQGLRKSSPDTIRNSGPDCDRWGRWSSCQEGFVVTGFVARFNQKHRGTNLPDALVGLQAVCREVIVK